jgi:hypothetical protein
MKREQLKQWVAALSKGRRHPASAEVYDQEAAENLRRAAAEARPPHKRAEYR